MARGANRPSELFREMLDRAKKKLELEHEEASTFNHRTLRGDERAAALADFLGKHLGSTYEVSKGECMDYLDQRTGQLDILVFDTNTCAPVHTGRENLLVPAESLFVVIEVKSILTRAELQKCFVHAAKLRKLRPFKGRFVAAQQSGHSLDKKKFRCLYAIFAYDTDISEVSWVDKEYTRMNETAAEEKLGTNLIDIVLVLNRGIIRPADSTGKANNDHVEDTFLEFYLHLINFLRRERPRRPDIDWQCYTSKTAKGWIKLK